MSREEFDQVFGKRFDQLDKNNDGDLTPAEYVNARVFQLMDKDADGQLSRQEFLGHHGANFEGRDKDGSGTLTVIEM